MIIGLPRHPNYLSQDPESNSRTFLEQFALVYFSEEELCGKFLIVPQSDSCFRLDPPLNQREEGDVIKIPQTTQTEPIQMIW